MAPEATKLPEPLGPSKHAILHPLVHVEYCVEFRGEGIGDSRCARASWLEICCRIPARFLYAEQAEEPPLNPKSVDPKPQTLNP